MRALVTGCAGFIGSHLVESLLADGWSVVGVDSFLDNYDASDKRLNLQAASEWETFELHEADLADAVLDRFVDGCDVIFHLAAEPGVRESWGERFDSYVRNNVLATQRLLEAAKQEPAARFVYASSSSIYGQAEVMPTLESTLPRPFSPYGVTKLAAEHLCQLYHGNHGVQAVILRFFSVYGPRQRPDMAFNRFCRAVLDDQPIGVFGAGDQIRDFTYVADVVSATRSAAETPAAVGEIYNVGGGAQVELMHAIRLLEKFAGRPVSIEHQDAQAGDIKATGADITRARTDLSYEPSARFEDGLRAEFEWIRAGSPAATPSS